MADEKPEEKGDDKKSKMNPKVIGAVVVVLGAAWYFFLGPGGGSEAQAAVTTTTITLDEEGDGAILPVGTLTVNLTGEGTRFGRVAFALVLVEGVDPLTVEGKLPLILDAALSELAGFTAEDLLDNSGQEKLRSVLSSRARELLNTEQDEEAGVVAERIVKRVVLTDLLVQ